MTNKILLLLTFLLNLSLYSQPADNMVLIKGGWFDIGSLAGSSDEQPIKRVFVDDFYLADSEVTVWEYLQAMQDGAVGLPDWWNREYFPEKQHLSAREWMNLPVTGISWQDAVKFCKWKGKGYRLPSEAEWEYAARAGTQTEYLWGDHSSGGDFLDNYDRTALQYAAIKDGLQPVKSFLPNAFGLYDMTGNVWEWCEDVYADDYYSFIAEKNPVNSQISADKSIRSVRGGSWDEFSFNLRIANRSYGEPDSGYRNIGFRILYQAEGTALHETK